jgi:hypothetical protein
LTELSFELLTGVVNAAFDLIEFVKTRIEGQQDVKSAGGGIAVVGRCHCALEGKWGFGMAGGHERLRGRE